MAGHRRCLGSRCPGLLDVSRRIAEARPDHDGYTVHYAWYQPAEVGRTIKHVATPIGRLWTIEVRWRRDLGPVPPPHD